MIQFSSHIKRQVSVSITSIQFAQKKKGYKTFFPYHKSIAAEIFSQIAQTLFI